MRMSAFKQPSLTVTFANREPQTSPIQRRAQRTHRKTSMEPADAEWQTHWSPRRPQGLPDPPALPLRNRFARLLEEVVEEDSAYSQEWPKLPSQLQKTPGVGKMKRRLAVWTQVVSPPETNCSRSIQSYVSSYFLPGKVFLVELPHFYKTLGALPTCRAGVF